jgi:hypothetical protein
MNAHHNNLPRVLPPWLWRFHGDYALLYEGAVPRLALLWRRGWEVAHADGTVIRDDVSNERLPDVLATQLPALRLEQP